MNLTNLTNATLNVLKLLDEYSGSHVGKREMLLDPILYGYLEGKFGNMSRQHYVYMYGSTKPKRIDFRYGTHNPVVIEFAVRSPQGGGTLYGSQNRSELRKLCRVKNTSARLRVLLLIDLHPVALKQCDLRQTYDSQTSGAGNFSRHPVRVLYVHRHRQFHFLWKP